MKKSFDNGIRKTRCGEESIKPSINAENDFEYSYSATENDEIENIRKKYLTDERKEKIEKLKKLDGNVWMCAMYASIIEGCISVAIFVGGLIMVLKMGSNYFVAGIVLGILGIIGTAFAYPFYNYISEKRKKKVAPEILAISEELLKEKGNKEINDDTTKDSD